MKALILLVTLSATSICACDKAKKTKAITTSHDYELAESLFNVKNDSSFYYFYQIATVSKDSLEVAMAYNYMAALQSIEGDYFGAQESLLLSLRFLDQDNANHQYCLASDYNELGNTNLNLKNYKAAITYYDEALKFTTDDAVRLFVLNGKAVVFQKQGLYSQAVLIYQSIIDQAKQNRKEKARVLSNYAKAKWLQNPKYNAAPYLLNALHIRTEEKDYYGLNASYSHLSEFYFNSHPDSSLYYAKCMYEVARHNQSPDDQLEALEKLIPLSTADTARLYFHRYRELKDSIQTARNAAKNQFALIRYESEKNRAANLVLQKENTERKVQLIKQQVILAGTILLFVIAGVLAFVWLRRRKQEMEWRTQTEMRESRLKTSQKVHDVVANGLYRVMTEVEHSNTLDKNMLLNKIDALYNKSRDISYEDSDSNNLNWQEPLPISLMSFANDQTKVLVTGYDNSIWRETDPKVKQSVEITLNELMVNMKKHSRARNVVIMFNRQVEFLRIEYKDDGLGFGTPIRYGNGLRNTESRIGALGGKITFGNQLGKGAKIIITIPISNK